MAENPHAAILYYWDRLQRQIRIEGTVEKLSTEESEAYFHSRPRDAQIGAWASHQSAIIASREILEKEVARLEKQYQGQTIPLTPCWGGFRLAPQHFEFWQGRKRRLHDRIAYDYQEGMWIRSRLSP